MLDYSLEQWHTSMIGDIEDTPIDVARAYPFDRLGSEIARTAGTEVRFLSLPDSGNRREI